MASTKTKIVGILNITPDSFADGGKYNSIQTAIDHARQMFEEGADIVDIGAESTRPDATPLSHEEEWERIQPILEDVVKLGMISIDTYHHETAKRAIELGVSWINDVSGCEDPQMIEAIKQSNAKIVVMHNLGIPADKSVTLPDDEDCVGLIFDWAKDKIDELGKAGINKNRIIFDPGIGFGKTAEQSFLVIQEINRFKELNVEILVGHSEKSFLTLFTDRPAGQRQNETRTFSAFLANQDIDYVRVHDVAGNLRAISNAAKYA